MRHSRRLDALARITSYMREHYQEELKLTEVANMFGYSDAYLSRMFQKYANVNFKTYLQDIRMTYAYRELLNSDKTSARLQWITDLAAVVHLQENSRNDMVFCQVK